MFALKLIPISRPSAPIPPAMAPRAAYGPSRWIPGFTTHQEAENAMAGLRARYPAERFTLIPVSFGN